MRTHLLPGLALLAATLLAAAPASANMCQAEGGLTCQTGMPIDGYCECTAHGVTRGGTVVGATAPRPARRAPKADCAASQDAPGCPH